MSRALASIEHRFQEALRGVGVLPGQRVLVALSGGCDSVVLLHLLRFADPGLRVELVAAHFDHAMRPDSDADLAWVRGLCAAWDVPLIAERHTGPPLRGEDDARRARYEFLRRSALAASAGPVLTAHHADDQAETVLFRIVRGTGLPGLGGILGSRSDAIARPLLGFWRRELERYARRAGLRWRTDPSNLAMGPARNRIRRVILPEIERHVAPAARRGLVRLAESARETGAALDALLAPLEAEVARPEGDAFVLARAPLRSYDSAVAALVVRRLLRQFGVVPSRSGTRLALQFITDAPSGREFQLPGGVRMRTEFDVVRLERARELPPDLPVAIAGAPPPDVVRDARLRIRGREYRVRWERLEKPPVVASDRLATLELDGLRFPLLVRGWKPGDRLRTAAGPRRLKKLFGAERVPRTRREQLPVLVDAAGEVLWVGGLERGAPAPPANGGVLAVAVVDD